MRDPITFTDRLRISFAWLINPIVEFLYKLGVTPNMLTIVGFLGIALGAVFAARGNFPMAGLMVLLMTPFDALDGALARRRGESQEFGAFVDSVSDRYGELVVYGGILWWANQNANLWLAFGSYLAAFGSVLVSYIRARAQSVGLEAKVGLLSRVERYFILGPTLLFNIPLIGVSIIAIGANLTALQRIWHVRQQSRQMPAKRAVKTKRSKK
ncbi:MAG TPA: CDP-alcohol phosphatidyltransferase family protein [Anaerolineales bacterium]|nr:CDP-alcohol phosphatidyltransferase family protein [Anaerolineales bacterium]HRQ91984.1 CDP-alcohol phosphatidyltransferase family protein [Anaerolineales bacterium]